MLFWEAFKNSTKKAWYFSLSLLLFVLINNQLSVYLCFHCIKTNRTPFQCLQKYQIYNKDLKRKEWTKGEDQMLLELVQEMRVGSHIPYKKSKWPTSENAFCSPVIFSFILPGLCLLMFLYTRTPSLLWFKELMNFYFLWMFPFPG